MKEEHNFYTLLMVNIYRNTWGGDNKMKPEEPEHVIKTTINAEERLVHYS